MLVFVVDRENELLKHQLKKYVSAVQLLRQQGAHDEGTAAVDCVTTLTYSSYDV